MDSSAIAPVNGHVGWLHSSYNRLVEISLTSHIILSAIIRALLICYGQLHDLHSTVPYTDIDYKVVTDGARHVLDGGSPFARHTYRYSPLMAYLQIPNVLLHSASGKIIYATFDILLAILIYSLVRLELHMQCQKAVQHLLIKFGKNHKKLNQTDSLDERNHPEKMARAAASFWLYNPLTAIISTRGSGDSFSSFFVILTIYLIIVSEHKKPKRYWLVFAAGLAHGFVIHLRLYPLLFSLAYYLALSTSLAKTPRALLRAILLPNLEQLSLIFGTLITLFICTLTFYSIYGWEYIYEAHLYHFLRKDVRHNFSLHFILQYLSSAGNEESTVFIKFLILAPQILLIFYLSLSFGQFRQTLPFCIFTLAFVMVSYNSVITSQYFIWYLAILPVCLNNIKQLSMARCIALLLLWLGGQALWLLPAYLLEFETWRTFYWIGMQGAVFFIINGYILMELINHYGFTSFKINYKKLF